MDSRPSPKNNVDDDNQGEEKKSSFSHLQQTLSDTSHPSTQHRSWLARPIIIFGGLIGGFWTVYTIINGALALSDTDRVDQHNHIVSTIMSGSFAALSFCSSAVIYKCLRKYNPDPKLTIPEEERELAGILISETDAPVDIPAHPTKEQVVKLGKQLTQVEINNIRRVSIFSNFAKNKNGLQKMAPLVGDYLGVQVKNLC